MFVRYVIWSKLLQEVQKILVYVCQYIVEEEKNERRENYIKHLYFPYNVWIKKRRKWRNYFFLIMFLREVPFVFLILSTIMFQKKKKSSIAKKKNIHKNNNTGPCVFPLPNAEHYICTCQEKLYQSFYLIILTHC